MLLNAGSQHLFGPVKFPDCQPGFRQNGDVGRIFRLQGMRLLRQPEPFHQVSVEHLVGRQ